MSCSLKIFLSWFVFFNLSIFVNLEYSLNLKPLFESFYLLISLWGLLGIFCDYSIKCWMVSRFFRENVGSICTLHEINGIFCPTIFSAKYISSFVCLLTLEWCFYSFYLFETYISSFWSARCDLTFF